MSTDRTHVLIPREAIEAEETLSVVQGLSVMVVSPTIALASRGRVVIAVEGYDTDSRELWEIPELRRYFQMLDADFPYWFAIADLSSHTLLLIAACLCRVTSAVHGGIQLERHDMGRFFARGFGAMNHVWETHGWSNEENEARSDEILRYFAALQFV